MKATRRIRNSFYLALLGSFLLLLPNLLPIHFLAASQAEFKNRWDQFDPSLVSKFRSVHDIIHFADSESQANHSESDTLSYFNLVANLLRNRFYHGYSYYSTSEDWIAATAGMFYKNLSAIVIPNDILKYPMAACSQQSMVLMACFRKKGVSYRKVSFHGHYAVEGFIDGSWYFFDTDMEPDFSVIPRKSIAELTQEHQMDVIYRERLTPEQMDTVLGDQGYGIINKKPARNANKFHKVTKLLSRTLWILPFLLSLFLYWKLRKARNPQG